MRRLIRFVTSVGIPWQRGRVDMYAVRPGSDLADVTDSPDSEDIADRHPYPLAT